MRDRDRQKIMGYRNKMREEDIKKERARQKAQTEKYL